MTDGPPSKPVQLLPYLTRSDEDIKTLFRSLETVADVAHLLEIPETQFTYAIWRKPEEKRYRTWAIRKRNGGARKIDAPTKTHKILQMKLAYALHLVAHRRSAAHGFIPGKSIVTNAAMHVRSRWVLNVDLKDFFPSIHFGRVRGTFKSKPYSLGERAATAMAQLCCHNKRLPQGAPTSPTVSNMVCAKLDGELRRLAEVHGCRYTRYADDLTFSTNKHKFPVELACIVGDGTKAAVGASLGQVIEQNSFEINPEKVRLQSRFTRQQVTGLVVNRRPNVRRVFISQIRAMLHAWETHGYDAAQSEFLTKYDSKHRPSAASDRIFEKVIQGKLAFLKQVRGKKDARYIKLRQWLLRLQGKDTGQASEQEPMEYDVFVCHASEDKANIVQPLVSALTEAQIRVWVDWQEMGFGDGLVKGINSGLSRSRFVVLVLSPPFIAKNWPEAEMNSIMNIEITTGVVRALPIMVGDAGFKSKCLQKYPLLADKIYEDWDRSDIGRIVTSIKSKLALTM